MQYSAAVPASVVVAAYNEEAYLATMLRAVAADPATREVVVVENGSTDGTADVAKTLAEELPEVRVVSLEHADYGAALRSGILAASEGVVVCFDVDYYDLDFLHRALGLLERPDGPAIVLGSKRAPGSRDERPRSRRLVTAAFSFALRRGLGLRASDTHGMKAMRRGAVLPLVRRCRFGTDLFDTELVLRAERSGLEVIEIPVTVAESRPARTSIARRATRTLVGLARLRKTLRRELHRDGAVRTREPTPPHLVDATSGAPVWSALGTRGESSAAATSAPRAGRPTSRRE